jgi:hypothetical protein
MHFFVKRNAKHRKIHRNSSQKTMRNEEKYLSDFTDE